MLLQGVSELLLQERNLLGQFSLRALEPLLSAQAVSADEIYSHSIHASGACMRSVGVHSRMLAHRSGRSQQHLQLLCSLDLAVQSLSQFHLLLQQVAGLGARFLQARLGGRQAQLSSCMCIDDMSTLQRQASAP